MENESELVSWLNRNDRRDIPMAHAEGNHYSTFDLRKIVSDEIAGAERGYARGPVRALMSALLFDGIQSFIAYSMLDDARQLNSRYREAYNWVNNLDNEYVFSFNCVCEALGIDSQFLRLGLINVCNSKSDMKRSRRNF